MKNALMFFLPAMVMIFNSISGQNLTPTEIVRIADEKFNGEKSGYSVMAMTIVRPSWERTVEFRSWSLGTDYALTLITAPAREKGQSFLKRSNEMWSWNPSINRLIKLPSSMMSQGWMGSDYTNDDILRESSAVNDYTHQLEGEESVGDRACYKIKLEAKPDAGIIWGQQVWWIDKKDYIIMKAELFDEDGYLERTEIASDLKVFDGRLVPSVIELIPAEKEGNRTIVKISEMKFNIEVEESFFSQQNMKSIR
ncbi:MAG TPA: outer membrane lipoprotein-sorting protein [Bacteroidales bacterium]|nr:outer membrane lipoprotein-sorting protein [Bacteroidales bacterium]